MILKYIFLINVLIVTSLSNIFSDDLINVIKDFESSKERSFKIDQSSNGFLKDGKPFRYISGTLPYFRILRDDWRDRFQKLRHAGCNAVQTYIEWVSHEPEPGVYNFDENLDIFSFLKIASEEDLLVILRLGPYIDAERDMGGLPYWLLRTNPTMRLRTMDPSYIHYVDRWFSVLLPKLRPYLYENGGPVIMLQVENEYGSYQACDFYYTAHLRDLFRKILGPNVVLFTTDGPTTYFLKCGKIQEVYATVDFGPGENVTEAFRAQRIFEPHGPLINSEFYPGWIDHWGEPHSTRNSTDVTKTLDEILSMNASVNIYVFNGGTSFGLMSGANIIKRFMATPTSYDFDAPLTEAGDPTEKYYAIRNITQKYVKLPPGPVPGPSDKYAYGDVRMNPKTTVFELAQRLESSLNKWPLTFEELSYFNGIVVYSTEIPYMIPDPARLSLYDLHDRGYVFVNNEYRGIVSREQELFEVPISARPNQTLTIVVESQGRVCYGDKLNDFKGITTNVTIGFDKIPNWKMAALPLTNATKLREIIKGIGPKIFRYKVTPSRGMMFYEGTFNCPLELNQPQDTFIRLDGWTKGYVWINNFLLGRYWPVVGPQVTLYIPRSVLKLKINTILVLELEKSPCEDSGRKCIVSLVDVPEINGPTPQW